MILNHFLKHLTELPADLALNSDQCKPATAKTHEAVFCSECAGVSCEEQPWQTHSAQISHWFTLALSRASLRQSGALSAVSVPCSYELTCRVPVHSHPGARAQRQWRCIVRFLNLQCSDLPGCEKVTWSQLMKVTGSACHLPCSLCAVQTSTRLLKPQALYISSALKPVARGITAQNLSTGFSVSDLTSHKPLLSALAAQIRWKAAPSSQKGWRCTTINISLRLFLTNVPHCKHAPRLENAYNTLQTSLLLSSDSEGEISYLKLFPQLIFSTLSLYCLGKAGAQAVTANAFQNHLSFWMTFVL